MANKGDTVFFAGYGFVIIMLGVVIMLFSLGALDPVVAFGLWLLTTGLILVGLGTVRTDEAPHGSRVMVGGGLFFAIIAIALMGIILEFIPPVTALALLILLAGIGVVVMGLRRGRSPS
jgi:hypothetical protein